MVKGKTKTASARKSERMMVQESLEKFNGKRKYGLDGTQKTTQKKQKISNEDGWNSRMRTKFYKLSGNANTIILKSDMTDPTKRPEGVNGKKDVQKGKTAEGFWSDSYLDRCKASFKAFLKFVVERDEERRKNGFYKDNPKVPEIKDLKDLNHHDVQDYIDTILDEERLAAGSLRTYVGHIQKVSEATSKHGIAGHANLVTQKNLDTIPERRRESFTRNIGATDGMRGFTAEQADKIVEYIEEPYVRAGALILAELGLRKDTFYKLKWRDVLDANNKVKSDYIELFRPGLMKGGREQIVETNEKVAEALQLIWDNGNFQNEQAIFGSTFSTYTFEKEMKKACERADLDWKSYHAFRRATTEKFDRKTEKMTKEQLVDGILRYVDIEIPHRRTGELYKPHNPIVEKRDPIMVPKLDSEGNQLFKKDGTPILVVERRQKRNGKWYVPTKVRVDETGHPVMGPRWTKDELMNSRIDFLRNMLNAEQHSHNRSDANGPYRFDTQKSPK